MCRAILARRAGRSWSCTLVKLLTGMYPPTSGRIFADDTDLSGIGPVSWRRGVSGACQDFVQFQTTLGDGAGAGAGPALIVSASTS